MSIIENQNVVQHSGVAHDENPPGRGSGRFPWGTGDNPYQHMFTFKTEVARMRKEGLTNSDIAKALIGKVKVRDGVYRDATATDLNAGIAIATKELRKKDRQKALEIFDETKSLTKTAQAMNKSVSSIQSLLDPIIAERTDKYTNTAELLKKKIDESPAGIVDISDYTELSLGVPRNTKEIAVVMLEEQGYVKTWVKVPVQGKPTPIKYAVLAKRPEPDMSDKDVYIYVQQNKDKISAIAESSPDMGKTFWKPEFPSKLDMDRVYIKYAEDGGKEKDGVIELRKNVPDLSLGSSEYAQVRIMTDDKLYLKGMAMYSDDIPDGYDVVFNTNKHKGTEPKDVFKPMNIDERTGEILKEQPFGATIKKNGQYEYDGADGKKHLSPINKITEEGDWDSWSRTLSQQFLSKQPTTLIKQQLTMTVDDKRLELEKIQSLTNPALKKKLLFEFADNCEKNAADLSATGFKRQAYQVLLPSTKVPENEIYAPNFNDGEEIALIRYPHGGIFEIPILRNNTKNKDAQKILSKNSSDAVLINPKTAEILSGADFDGDTALVIPLTSNKLKISSRKPLEQLKDFDPKELYQNKDLPKMKERTKQRLMGEVTNLITDMTLQNPSWNELSRAVKHSMVVIDAKKHSLDYTQSEADNGIRDLKYKYQGKTKTGQPKGASTILSQAKSKTRIPEQKEITDKLKMTPDEIRRFDAGEKIFRPTGRTTAKTGKIIEQQVPKMYITDDAMTLVRDPMNQKEILYADFANNLKSIAKEARSEARSITRTPVNQSSKIAYKKEVEDLKNKLANAEISAPLERKARTVAQKISNDIIRSNPEIYDNDYQKKQRLRAQQLQKARAELGSKKDKINITDREWEAIQADALSFDVVNRILQNADPDEVKKRAMPKRSKELTTMEKQKIKNMKATGRYTNADIAEALGVSASTISKYLNGKDE